MSYAQEELRTIRNLKPRERTEIVLRMYTLVGRLNKSPDQMAIGQMLATLIQYCEAHNRVDLVSCLEAYNNARL